MRKWREATPFLAGAFVTTAHCAINAENSSSFSIDDDDDHDAGAVLIVAVDADAYVARG